VKRIRNMALAVEPQYFFCLYSSITPTFFVSHILNMKYYSSSSNGRGGLRSEYSSFYTLTSNVLTSSFTVDAKVEIMGHIMDLPLRPIIEEPEPEPESFWSAVETLLSPVPTPYFTPRFFFPNSPPSTPDPMEIAMCISHRVPVRWRHPVPPSPRISPVEAFPALLDYSLTSSQALANVQKLAQLGGAGYQRNFRPGSGFDLPGLRDGTLYLRVHDRPVSDNLCSGIIF
jgi:hypothetical protein